VSLPNGDLRLSSREPELRTVSSSLLPTIGSSSLRFFPEGLGYEDKSVSLEGGSCTSLLIRGIPVVMGVVFGLLTTVILMTAGFMVLSPRLLPGGVSSSGIFGLGWGVGIRVVLAVWLCVVVGSGLLANTVVVDVSRGKVVEREGVVIISGVSVVEVVSGGKVVEVVSGGKVVEVVSGSKVVDAVPGGKTVDVVSGGEEVVITSGGEVVEVVPGGKIVEVVSEGEVVVITSGGEVVVMVSGNKVVVVSGLLGGLSVVVTVVVAGVVVGAFGQNGHAGHTPSNGDGQPSPG